MSRTARRRGVALLAGAALAAMIGAAALADGVVIASTSSAHAVGDRVEAGALGLEPGAEVTVLDRSGRVRRIAGPGGRYEDPGSARGSARGGNSVLAAARLAVSVDGLGRRSGLGAVRGGEEDCEVEPGSRSMQSAECVAAEPIAFSVWSEFEGAMACDWLADDGVWRRMPLTDDGAPARVEVERLYEFPLEPSDDWPATVSADVSLRCHAIDAAAWSQLQPYWRADLGADEARALMRSFAEIADGSFTEVAVEE